MSEKQNELLRMVYDTGADDKWLAENYPDEMRKLSETRPRCKDCKHWGLVFLSPFPQYEGDRGTLRCRLTERTPLVDGRGPMNADHACKEWVRG